MAQFSGFNAGEMMSVLTKTRNEETRMQVMNSGSFGLCGGSCIIFIYR
jgi:hypothetical protein